MTVTLPPLVAAACERARAHLLDLQHEDGWWKGEAATNVTMDAADLLMRQFLGIREAEATEESARWIRSQQSPEGFWANFHGGPADLSTSVEAYTALRVAGDPADATHLRRAREFILDCGGIEATRVLTRIWLALFGEWPWDTVPVLPPETIFLPSWFPLNVYAWASWARLTGVPLMILTALRPRRFLGVSVAELRTGIPIPANTSWNSWTAVFHRLDQVLHAYQRRPMKSLRRRAIRAAEAWILARQENDGSWGGLQLPSVHSILALNLLGYSLDHPVLRAALSGLEGFTIQKHTEHGVLRRLEAFQSPVWDTALAVTALLDAGTPADDPALLRAADWLLSKEIRQRGDWAVRRPTLPPGGWSLHFANDYYPDTDDTAEVTLALRRLAHPEPERLRTAIDRAVTWLLGMQSRDGGWASFDADNTRTLCEKLPFCDFGAMIDPPTADVTAHVIEALVAHGLTRTDITRRAVRWLLEHQEADGSWFGRWGANHVYGTAAVVPALIAAGLSPQHEAIHHAITWLLGHQNTDGGWGEDLRSYRDPTWIGRGTSTASQTAWAMLALLATGRPDTDSAVHRAARWLTDTQRTDGTWNEPQFTGTGFPGDFFINYHLYRLVFPLTALGRYQLRLRTQLD
jgi:squalene-hopene/tetraprenyl-beta-curcumene cyclase